MNITRKRVKLASNVDAGKKLPCSASGALCRWLDMNFDASALQADISLVERVLEGEEGAMRELQGEIGPALERRLAACGASYAEIEEVVAQLWADCAVAVAPKQPLLAGYNGRSPLKAWLSAIVSNRWISLKRRENVRSGVMQEMREETFACPPEIGERDSALAEIIANAFREACAKIDAEQMVIVKLVHLHGISQREVAALWRKHESYVSRVLKNVEESIAAETLAAVRRSDPYLQPTWDDFLRICESLNVLYL